MVYTVDVVNSSTVNASLDLTVPIPSFTSLVDMGTMETPLELNHILRVNQRIQWLGQTIGSQQIKTFHFTVNLSSALHQ